MKFYAACLASYNNGVLHGVWIDAESDVDSMQAQVNAMLRESRFPNVMVIAPNGYEQAAKSIGWTQNAHNGYFIAPIGHETRIAEYDDWKELCEQNGIEPLTVPSAEEWAMHDSEGLPSSLGEFCGLQVIADYMEFVESVESETGTDDSKALAQAMFSEFGSVEYAANELQNYIGIYDSFRDYADDAADEMIACFSVGGKAPRELIIYFDYESYAHDLKHGMTVIDLPCGSVAVFHQ